MEGSYQKAERVMHNLQSSRDFEHFRENSRGIRIQTDSFLEEMAEFAKESGFDRLSDPINTLIRSASDKGTYVRIVKTEGNSGVGSIDIDIRGHISDDELKRGPLSAFQLEDLVRRRSGLEIVLFADGRRFIHAHSDSSGGDELAGFINDSIARRLLEDKQKQLIDGIVDIVSKQVAQSGEFLDIPWK